MTTSNINNIALTGDALVAKVSEMKDATKTDIVTACGYFRENGNPNFTAFYEALLAAKGFEANPVDNTDKETITYQVCVPVYVTCFVEAKPGLSDDEVLAIAKSDPTVEVDDESVCDQVQDVFNGWVKPAAEIIIDTLD